MRACTVPFRVWLTLGVTGALTGVLPARLWTDQHGREFEAEMVSATAEEVVLTSEKFQESYTLPLAKLSRKDQDYVVGWRLVNASVPKDEEEPEPEPAPLVTTFIESVEEPKSEVDTAGVEDNFGAEWPGIISKDPDFEVKVVEEDAAEKRYVYQSPNYEFVSDVALSDSLVKKFALMFEATREYCRLLPISLKKAHVEGGTHRNRVLLFETFGTYVKNGGPPQSAGVYMPAEDLVMIPLTSLGVRKVGSSYRFDWDESSKTVPHELAHQLTDEEYYAHGARGWFSEGLAEYIAVTPYRSGKYNNKTLLGSAKDFVIEYGKRGRGGRALGDELEMPPLKEFFLQDYSSFLANANFNYGMSLLLVYYFFHMDLEGERSAITAYLKALREGREGEEALKALLQWRSYEDLQNDIVRAWRSRGIRIQFLEETGE